MLDIENRSGGYAAVSLLIASYEDEIGRLKSINLGQKPDKSYLKTLQADLRDAKFMSDMLVAKQYIAMFHFLSKLDIFVRDNFWEALQEDLGEQELMRLYNQYSIFADEIFHGIKQDA